MKRTQDENGERMKRICWSEKMKKKEKKISLYGRWKNRAKFEKEQSWWQKARVALTWWLKGNGVISV